MLARKGGTSMAATSVLRSIHVGVGQRGVSHWRAYLQSSNWRIAALVDISQEALDFARKEIGLPESSCFKSLEEALEKVEADAVVISTPPALHAPQVEVSLEAGRHVFVEKPFTYDLQKAVELVEKAESRGLRIMVCQNDRLSAAATAMIEAVQSGRYGELGFCVFDHFKARRAPYHLTPHMHLWSQGVHQIDTLMAVVGREVEYAFGTSMNPVWCDWPSESTVFAQLVFEGGVIGQYFGTSNAQSSRSSLMMRAEFARGAIVFDERTKEFCFDGPDGKVDLPVRPSNAGAQLASMFYDYIVHGTEPPMSGRRNLKTLRVLDAIVRSTVTGERIRLKGA